MKFVYSLLVVTLLLFAGCKQDFQTTVPKYVDTPVVYGLLATNDYGSDGNTHYIRIQKGYLLQGNAYVAAGITDSIYYPNNLTVQLFSSNGFSVYNLTQIDGATVGLNKDTGIFANTPNYLYTCHQFLDSTKSYTLLVTRNSGTDTVAMATTSMVNSLLIYSPSNLGYSQINFSNVQPAVISWAAANNAGVYDLTLRFYYTEVVTATNAFTNDSIDIPVFTSYIPPSTGGTSNTLTYTLPSRVILDYLASHLTNNPLVHRIFGRMKFTFAAGGTALTNYFISQQAQSGLTSSNALPPFTNVTNGVGLLSSREYQSIDNIGLSNAGLDSLACDPSASFLNFTNSFGHTCN
jgi:hypothetical protein